MGKTFAKQMPLKLRGASKTEVRAQFAALGWRVKNGQVQICLITSRTRKRWIIPKGWPMHGETPALAAATEAYEEAGLRGEAIDLCLGVYTYRKAQKPLDQVPIVTLVYPLRVTQTLADWPERHQRRRKWFRQDKAALKLQEPALRRIVSTFRPDRIGR